MQQYLSEKLFSQIRKPKTKQATALLAVFLLTATYFVPLVAAETLTRPTLKVNNSFLYPGDSATVSMNLSPSGGTLPYTYIWSTWLGNSPTHTNYPSTNQDTFQFTTTTDTSIGVWHVSVQVTDSAGTSVNSMAPVNIAVVPRGTQPLVGASISPKVSTIYPGGTVTLSMANSPSGGSGSYTYQWNKLLGQQSPTNQFAFISGATGTSYVFSESTVGRWQVNIITTDTYGLSTWTYQGPAVINVIPLGTTLLTAPTIVSSTYTLQPSQTAQLTMLTLPTGGVGSYNYQWYKWRDGTMRSPISGATGESYNFTPDGSTPTGLWHIDLEVRDANGIIAQSRQVNINVVPTGYTPLMGSIMSVDPNMIHPGQSTTITATPSTGGYGTITYRWEKWLGNTPGTPHETISGITGTSYTFTTSTETPVGAYHFARIARDELGFDAWPQFGDAIVMVVPESYTQLNGAILTTTKDTLNAGQTATLSASTPATGGQTPYSYQWQCAHGDNNFQNIEGAINPTYDFTATSSTATGTYRFQLMVTDSLGASAWPQQGPVNVDVVPTGTPDLIAPTITASTLTLHRGETSRLTVSAAVQGGQEPYQLQWNKWAWSGFSGPQPIVGATGTTYDFTPDSSTSYGLWNFELQVTDNLGCVVWSQQVNILVAPEEYVPLTGAIVAASPSQITPSQTIHLSTPTAPTGGQHTTYQWMKMKNGQPWTEIPGATTLDYDYITESSMAYGTWQFALVATDDYMRQWPIQGPVNVLVVPSGYTPITGATVTATPNQINPGQTIHLTTTLEPHGGHGTLTYQWMKWKDGAPATEIPGATTLNYDYVTDSSMAYGQWHFALVAKDDYTEQWPTDGSANVLVVPSGYITLTGAVVAASPNQVERSQTIHLSCTTAPNGGLHTTYQWMKWQGNSPATAIPGATSLSYDFATDSSMAYGYWQFALVARDDYTEQWPTTGPATVLVVPSGYTNLVAPTIQAAPSQIYPSQTIHLTMTKEPTGGYGSYSYQWYRWQNNQDAILITDATTPNYDYTTSASMLLGYWNFALVVTDSLGTKSYPITTVFVAPEGYVPIQQPTVYSNPSSIHPGETAHLQTTIPLSGGQKPYDLQWYIYQSSGWTPIDGATLATYDFTTDSSTSLGSYTFMLRVVDDIGLSSVNCITTVTVLSLGADPLTPPVIAASPTSIHPGDTVQLTITQMPTGGVEPYSYVWAILNPNNGQTTPIPDATSTTLDYTTTSTSPTGTYIFVLFVRDSQGNTINSMVLPVTVLNAETTPLSVPGVQVSTHNVPMLGSMQLTLSGSVSGGDGKYTYIWLALSQDNGQMVSIASANTGTLDYNLDGRLAPGNWKFALVVTDGSGQVVLGEASENVIVSPFVAPEVPWGTTIFAIFAAALVFVAVKRRRKPQL